MAIIPTKDLISMVNIFEIFIKIVKKKTKKKFAPKQYNIGKNSIVTKCHLAH
jgi:hypothetical protein